MSFNESGALSVQRILTIDDPPLRPSTTRSPMSASSVHLERTARAPVETLPALEQLLLDQIPPEGGVVDVEPPEQVVDLLLRVDPPGLELTGEEVEHQPPLAPVGRDVGEPTLDQVIAQHVG